MDFHHNRVYNKGNITNLLNNGSEERSLEAKISEEEDEYIVQIQLIGFDKDEIVIFIENDTLYIEANREDIVDEENDDYSIQECNYAYCQRSFSLQGIDRRAINAYYENDLIYIHLPKI